MKVLIVDGSKQSRRDTVEALGELTNITIMGAVSSARTALHALSDAPPDLVVTEVELPDGECVGLVEKIRRLERSPSIVVISGMPSDEQRQRYLAAGVDGYVERDAELRGLQEAVIKLGRRSVISQADTLRLLGRISAGVAHDLNNYLAAANALVALLQRHPEDPALWSQLRRSLELMAQLNASVLTYARGAAPVPATLDVAVIVRDVLATCAAIIPGNVRVTTDIRFGLRAVQGVASELGQLVLNLVINACDAMPQGGTLQVTLTNTGSAAVHLRVADTGVGIDARTPRGNGLGLGIVHAVVERHHAAVQFASRPGGGTIVDVMLPA